MEPAEQIAREIDEQAFHRAVGIDARVYDPDIAAEIINRYLHSQPTQPRAIWEEAIRVVKVHEHHNNKCMKDILSQLEAARGAAQG